jgi:DMSO/TMAO reductase YedYZ molybdopterin-dependent catalytic subunit
MQTITLDVERARRSKAMDIRNQLPVHPLTPDAQPPDGADGSLRVGGLVARPDALTAATLAALPRAPLTERFTSEEGWAVEGQAWEGIPLREALAACQPLPAARFVRVSAGSYWIALALDQIDHALLCDRLNGEPLSRAHGAPWRLVVAGGACFTSVKWVNTLELAAEPGAQTAEGIARGRLTGD